MKRVGILIAIVLAVPAATWTGRALLSRSLPDLQPWHRAALQSEFRAADYPDGIDFSEYQQLESKLMSQMHELLGDSLEPAQRQLTNRYFEGSPAHPSAWPSNWNLSYELIPDAPRGGIVLLHGASDSPYSMRALAEVFSEAGLYVIAPRLPGHGTIPGELTVVEVDDVSAVATMAMRRARGQLHKDSPLYLGGYSAGAALALQYALQAIEDRELEQAEALYMFSPAVGVSSYAVFALWDSWVSEIPAFEKLGWMGVRPEYDPFKYSSFPKQAGHLVYAIASQNQETIEKLTEKGRLRALPPIITFQSVVDATVSVSDVLDLHELLPGKRSQLVLFDVDRGNVVAPFLLNDGTHHLSRLAEAQWRDFDVTIVRNDDTDTRRMVADRRCPASEACASTTALEARWPGDAFSLSHVAIPFPPDDPLNGPHGKPFAPNGYNLGEVRAIGERGVLVIPAQDIDRIRYNPFFDYLKTRALEFCAACLPGQS